MGVRWQYGNVALEIEAALVHKGRRQTVPMYAGESLEHAMFKVSIAAHLLSWGYAWENIKWEAAPEQGPAHFRADLYVEAAGNLPAFWFECVGTQQTKLSTVVASLPRFRVARVMSQESFERYWNGPTSAVVDGKVFSINKITDWRERRKHTIAQREALVPPGAECWAIRGAERSPQILYAVARRQDGSFVYLETGEGWSLSGFRYIPSKPTSFAPLIPGIVGSDSWTGKNPSYYKQAAQSLPDNTNPTV